MDKEINDQLPLLDVLLKKSVDGQISQSIYRKLTHPNRYLNATLYHPAHLYSVVRLLPHVSRI